ncbi:MAG: NAD-dependent dihydropyrimidine dehydrogenase subunit PreA [Clostridiales bacterium]|nr:NAD-dependent dihydropyrimidine dehydrogenase subunit PreA [Clostridiales bacterium]
MANLMDLSIEYLGVKCENPFFLSSSPVGSNYDMVKKAFEEGWGGVFFKTVGIFIADECSPRFDNNAKESTPWIGFKNMEQISDKPLEDNLQAIHRLKRDYPDKIVVASIMGSSEDEWEKLSKMVTQAGADLIECNFSCPQMTSHAMGSDVGQNPDLVRDYSRAVSKETDLPVIAKMTPNIGNMEIPAIAAIEGGAKGVSAINTIKAITNIDLEFMTAMPVVNGKSSISGYSGAAVRPIGLRFITQMKQHPLLKDIQMSGIGGIETWRDALEYILVGCHNVQVTTAVMQYGYRIVSDMISGLSYYMEEQGFKKVEEMVGLALPNIVPAEELDRDFKIIVDIDHEKCIGCGRCYISCYDAAHQAINWDFDKRRPSVNDECVGCHLCINVCPVLNCITPGKVVWKDESKETPREINFKTRYE